MISLQMNKLYNGPGILDMRSLLPLSSEEVVVSWTNTRPEIHLLRKYPGRSFVLVVPDRATMERSATALGIHLDVPPETVHECERSFNTKAGGKWRKFVSDSGAATSRTIMKQVVAHYIRQGHDPKPLRKMMVESLFDGVPVMEFDVLLALRMSGAKV